MNIVGNNATPQKLLFFLFIGLPFMVLDTMLVPFVFNIMFISELDDLGVKIGLQLVIISGAVVVFILNLYFLKVFQEFGKLTDIPESRLITTGIKAYVFKQRKALTF